MTTFERLQKYSIKFYLVILVLTIPAYLLLYGASGHSFNIPTEDIIWILIIIISLILMVFYLENKEKVNQTFDIFKVLLTISLTATLFGGLRSVFFIFNFNYGDDIDILIRGIHFLVPLTFVLSNTTILIGLYKKWGLSHYCQQRVCATGGGRLNN